MRYSMPAEWVRHQATWLTWPRPDGISFPGRYEIIPPVYATLIRHLTEGEEVHINVWDGAMEATVREILRRHGTSLERVVFHHFPAYEPWCRDHGPIFVVREENGQRQRAVVDWGYNAWGGKYPPFDLDDAIPAHVARFRGLPLFQNPMVLEGGSVEVNGQGVLLTTTCCLLNPNRNPGLGRPQIEEQLRAYLGVRQVLWLSEGIEGDDTDGHIDNLARFVDATTIVAPVEEDRQDPNHAPLQENWRQLELMRDPAGRPFRLVRMPMPGRVDYEGQRLPASYMNFYIANGRVLVPTYRCPNDARAVAILQEAFADRKVIGVDSTDLIWGLGSFHCITQQEPAG